MAANNENRCSRSFQYSYLPKYLLYSQDFLNRNLTIESHFNVKLNIQHSISEIQFQILFFEIRNWRAFKEIHYSDQYKGINCLNRNIESRDFSCFSSQDWKFYELVNHQRKSHSRYWHFIRDAKLTFVQAQFKRRHRHRNTAERLPVDYLIIPRLRHAIGTLMETLLQVTNIYRHFPDQRPI